MRAVLTGIIFFSTVFIAIAQEEPAEYVPVDAASVDATAAGRTQGDYMIKKGDTLWDLSFHFLGDPFRWPEIWNANPYIKNPHLIYPGDYLVIPGFGGRGNASDLKTVKAADFSSKTKGFLEDDAVGLDARFLSDSAEAVFEEAIRAMSQKEYFTKGLIKQVAFLWTQKDAKGLIAPGDAFILKDKERESHKLFDLIKIEMFGNGTYMVGDTVDVFRCERYVKMDNKTVNLVRRIAQARIEHVSGKTAEAVLFEVWDVVKDKDRIAGATAFEGREIDTLSSPDIVISGNVFERVENTESPYLFQTFIIDRGSMDGVRLGDLFMVYPVEGKEAARQPAILGCTVHTGEKSSTLLIIKMFTNRLRNNDRVELVKRLVLK